MTEGTEADKGKRIISCLIFHDFVWRDRIGRISTESYINQIHKIVTKLKNIQRAISTSREVI